MQSCVLSSLHFSQVARCTARYMAAAVCAVGGTAPSAGLRAASPSNSICVRPQRHHCAPAPTLGSPVVPLVYMMVQ